MVLRNIHHSANLDELKYELQNLDHEITNISNIRQNHKKPTIFILCRFKEKAKQQRNI
jgi:hypothetical protein